jgi:hypothetical protein
MKQMSDFRLVIAMTEKNVSGPCSVTEQGQGSQSIHLIRRNTSDNVSRESRECDTEQLKALGINVRARRVQEMCSGEVEP